MTHVDGNQGRLGCQCCGGKTDYDAYCMQCHHPYNEWCARGDGKCPNCGYLVDDEGKCGRCEHQRAKENTQAMKATHCNYCGFMLDMDGTCVKDRSHEQATAGRRAL